MNKQSRILHTCASILALTLLLSGCSPEPTPTPLPTTAPTQPPSATATKPATAAPTPTPLPTTAPTLPPSATATTASTAAGSSKDACLECHGPFDKLVSATANYNAWQGGEKTSPHRYVPHDSKDIPECSNCHKQAHPLSPTAADISAMPKPNPQWCYTCHHAGVLQCGTCH